jgi:hypothetical protein
MKCKLSPHIWLVVFLIAFLLQACGANAPVAPTASIAVPTSTLQPPTPTITKTPFPSATPRPTRTPNLTATQQFEEWNAEAQSYVDAGYLTTLEGKFYKFDDFEGEWAQLNWYKPSKVFNIQVSDFFMSGHFKWSSAYRQADTSGCGFLFEVQENSDHYGVILDRSKVLFINMDYSYGYYRSIGTTRGSGRVSCAGEWRSGR